MDTRRRTLVSPRRLPYVLAAALPLLGATGCADWIMVDGFGGSDPPREPVPRWEEEWEVAYGSLLLEGPTGLDARGFRSEARVPDALVGDETASYVDTMGVNVEAEVRWEGGTGREGTTTAGLLAVMGPYWCDWAEGSAITELDGEGDSSRLQLQCKEAFGRRGMVVFARTDPSGPLTVGTLVADVSARLWAEGTGEQPPAGFEIGAFVPEPVWHRTVTLDGPPLRVEGKGDVVRSPDVRVRVSAPERVMAYASVRVVVDGASAGDAAPGLSVALAERSGSNFFTWDAPVTPGEPHRIAGLLGPQAEPPQLDRSWSLHLAASSHPSAEGSSEVRWTLAVDVFGFGEASPPELVMELTPSP